MCRYEILSQVAQTANWDVLAYLMGRLMHFLIAGALQGVVVSDARVPNWGYPPSEHPRPRTLKLIDCGGLYMAEGGRVGPKEVLANIKILLHSFRAAPTMLVQEALSWAVNAIKDGLDGLDESKLLEIQMGLQINQPIWATVCAASLASELGVDATSEVEELHQSLNARQVGTTALDEDSVTAAQRTQSSETHQAEVSTRVDNAASNLSKTAGVELAKTGYPKVIRQYCRITGLEIVYNSASEFNLLFGCIVGYNWAPRD